MDLASFVFLITVIGTLTTIAANMKVLFNLRAFTSFLILISLLVVFYKPATFLIVNLFTFFKYLSFMALIGIIILLIRLHSFLENRYMFDKDEYSLSLFVPIMILIINLLSNRIVNFSYYYAALSSTGFSMERLRFVIQNGRESVFCVFAITGALCCLLNTLFAIGKAITWDCDGVIMNGSLKQYYFKRITFCFLPLIFCTNFTIVLFDKLASIIV